METVNVHSGRTIRRRRRHAAFMRPLFGLLALAAIVGCNRTEQRRQRFPDDMPLRVVGGETLRAGDLVGKPWVINVWLPG